MLILLPFIAFALCFVLLCQSAGRSLRESFLCTSLLWGLFVAVTTEFLSLFSAITLPGLSAAWLAAIAVLSLLLYRTRTRLKFTIPIYTGPLPVMDIVLLATTIGIITVVGITALITPPNNWDSMAYHMARVPHWIQNQTIAFYPTSITRQTWAAPLAEYIILHLQILTHSDRLANLVQWWAMTVSIVGSSLIARTLGANRRGQIISALFCAALPMSILEGSSTQNDYVAAMWIIILAYCVLTSLTELRPAVIFFAAAALGLGMLTKPTSLFFAAPFLLWGTINGLKKQGPRLLIVLALAAAIPLLINVSHAMRNVAVNDNLLSPVSETKEVKNDPRNLQAMISNAVRYIGSNLAVNNDGINTAVTNSVRWLHERLDWDPDDRRFTFPDQKFHLTHALHEDNSCNTAATVVILIVSILFWCRYRRECPNSVTFYFLCVAGAYLLFCLGLKWQSWGNRLLLPHFVLFAPFIGVIASRMKPAVAATGAIILAVLCLPWLLYNTSRPIIAKERSILTTDREVQYFSNSTGMQFSYQRAVEELQRTNCRDVGLILGTNGWEYPLWAIWNNRHLGPIRMDHINVTNPLGKLPYPRGPFDPCAVVHDDGQNLSTLTVNNQNYTKTHQWAFLSIFQKDSDGKIKTMVRASRLGQIIMSSVQSDRILAQAQMSGHMDQMAVAQAFQLRQAAVEQAKQLDAQELNNVYNGLGSAVEDLFIKGNSLLLEGLSKQDPVKINQGQALLNRWNDWLQKNMSSMEKILR